ncbi:hypothetical protein C8N43_3900 [Litoreibacter ponti]|uniref:OmpA-like domain-containing protein n=1 Tax=Litoreibacter ponti TaxID=1510457 RepID=A0A2T6BCQ4_9RHOB|nr:hypothetical protein [Litoreibacter ponti]PTX53857.1 hypothetical protein C8N43_3900 [Litoreibacter ponti]
MSDSRSGQTPSEFRVGPLSLGAVTLVSALAALVLYLFEVLKRLNLDLPIALTMDGFDIVDTAIRNTFLIIVFSGNVIAILVLTCILVSLVVAGIALFTRVWRFTLVFLNRGALALIRELAVAARKALKKLSRSPGEDQPATWFDRVEPELARRIRERERGYQRAKEDVSERRKTVWAKLSRTWHRGRRVFWSWEEKSWRAASLRAILICAVATSVAVQQTRVMASVEEKAETISDQFLLRTASPPEHGLADKIGKLDQGPPWYGAYLDQAKQKFLKIFVQEFRPGTVTLTNTAGSATHLPLSATSAQSGDRTLQTDLVFYVGDFGNWALLAPIGEIEKRVLIRRTSILEFTACSIASQGATEAPEAQGRPLPKCPHPGSQSEAPPPELVALQGDVADLRATLSRTQDRFHWWFRNVASNSNGTTSSAPHGHSEFSGLNRFRANISDGLADVRERLARSERDLNGLSRENVKLAGKVWSSERRVTELGDAVTQQLTRFAELHTASTETRAVFSANLERSRTTVLHLSSRIETLERNDFGWRYVWGRLQALEDTVQTLPRTSGTGGLGEAPELVDLIREGITTPPSSVLTDFLRRRRTVELRECLSSPAALRHFVEFREGATRSPKDPGLQELVATFRAATESPIKERRLVVLQGGASYTGDPASNIRLSEQRAEWVKKRLLRAIFDAPLAEPTHLAKLALEKYGFDIVAFGLGERLRNTGHPSPRAVEVLVCALDQNPVFAKAEPAYAEEVAETGN